MRKADIIVYILGICVCILALITTDFMQIPVIIFLVLLTTRNKFAYQAGLVVFGAYFIQNALTVDIWGMIFVGFFAFTYVEAWKNSFKIGNKIVLGHLPREMQNMYALMFIVFLVFDFAFGVLFYGANALSPIFFLTVLLSSCTFLTIILICRKFYDAIYFYLGMLALSIITQIYYIIQLIGAGEAVVYAFASLLILIIEVFISIIFIKENK